MRALVRAVHPAEADAGSLYELALDFQERSQRAEAALLEQFQAEASRLPRLSDLTIADHEDERLTLQAGAFRAEVRSEDDGAWRTLAGPAELVEFYDPTDVFGGLADALAGPGPLHELALAFKERSQRQEASLLGQFEVAAGPMAGRIGHVTIVDDEEERLTLQGRVFRAEVLTDDGGGWRTLAGPEELVEFYDPTDVFGDLADALAEDFPAIDPENGTSDEIDEGEDARGVRDEREGAACLGQAPLGRRDTHTSRFSVPG